MRTKATYRMVEFIRPGGFWPYPYTLEQAFGVFAWMLRAGENCRDDDRRGRSNVRSLLSGKPTCVNFSEVDPIYSVADLERRFHYAILSDHGGPHIQQWRERHSITPDGKAVICFPHRAYGSAGPSEHNNKCALDALLGVRGRLGVQLNECHSRAREIVGVRLHWRGCYRFVLEYGYQGSVWYHELSRQRPREAFYTAFWRAQKALASLVDGHATSPGARRKV